MPLLPLQVMDSWLDDFRTKLADVSGLKDAAESTEGSKGLPISLVLIKEGELPHAIS